MAMTSVSLEDDLDLFYGGPASNREDELEKFLDEKAPSNSTPSFSPSPWVDRGMWIDDALEKVGNGPYQRSLFPLMLSLFANCSLNIIAPLFAEDRNSSDCSSDCINNVSTVEEEFNLTGDRAWLLSACGVVFVVGMSTSFVISGLFNDAFGRSRILIASVVVLILTNLLALTSQQFTSYLLSRLFGGFGVGACLISAWLLSIEQVAPPRFLVASVLFCGIPLGSILALIFGLICKQSWRLLYAFLMFPSFGLVITLCCLRFGPENSPHWLASHFQEREAGAVLEDIFRINERSVPGDFPQQTSVLYGSDDTLGMAALLFTHSPALREFMLVSLLLFCTLGFLEAGLNFDETTNFPSGFSDHIALPTWRTTDSYLNLFLAVIFQVPSFLVGFYLMRFVKLRNGISVCLLVSSVLCLLAAVLSAAAQVDAARGMGLLARMATDVILPQAILYVSSLIPGISRGVGLGMAGFACGVGIILGLVLALFPSTPPIYALLAMAGMGSAVSLVRLPDMHEHGYFPQQFAHFDAITAKPKSKLEDDDGADVELGGITPSGDAPYDPHPVAVNTNDLEPTSDDHHPHGTHSHHSHSHTNSSHTHHESHDHDHENPNSNNENTQAQGFEQVYGSAQDFQDSQNDEGNHHEEGNEQGSSHSHRHHRSNSSSKTESSGNTGSGSKHKKKKKHRSGSSGSHSHSGTKLNDNMDLDRDNSYALHGEL
eukprot:TRINITY_DN4450_c0_g1::TRINITY_DN4450_c0_g1_i1::g.7352::m.7352 TRINITY_DN4450_c0_g1::TRINITY_DN4450_c0_g1_i1::g.7352  ORF type:complete len:714 (+),score=89.44,sp/A9CB25/S22A4_PAPAN/22.89/1e-12,MFS_1/PF07690.11/3.9e-17,MFS_1/PF07690.11/5,Sugar_tr/PF00083.19/8.4e-11,Cytadhesin_P30/PF07271.6/0.78 TRINITY_DN4450_c0_g1_i1:110-2251(+)